VRALFVMLMLALASCAAGGSAHREVAAVVLDERARQAAVETARAGAGSEAALKAAAEAAPSVADPPV
jgi:hypothetical protein